MIVVRIIEADPPDFPTANAQFCVDAKTAISLVNRGKAVYADAPPRQAPTKIETATIEPQERAVMPMPVRKRGKR